MTTSLAPSALGASDDARPDHPPAGASSSPSGAAGPSEVPGSLGASGPTVMHPALLAAVLSWSDDMLLAWFSSQPASIECLSPRERAHVLGILEGRIPLTVDQIRRRHTRSLGDAAKSAAAAYIRHQLADGDHQQARARRGLEVGAVIKLGSDRYRVECHHGRSVTLRGVRGGRVTLTPPLTEAGAWSAWIGGIGAAGAKLRRYIRHADGSFGLWGGR